MSASRQHPALDRALSTIIARLQRPPGGLRDVFAPFPVVIGAHWLATPLRQGIAERDGVAANLVFLTVDEAIDRLVEGQLLAAKAWWWEPPPVGHPWSHPSVRNKLLRALRAPPHPAVAALATSLEVTVDGPIGWRALAFADQLAGAILAWLRDRPRAPLWPPDSAPPPWFTPLIATLEPDGETSPRSLRANLLLRGARRAPPGPWGGPLVVGTTLLPSTSQQLLDLFDAEFLPLVDVSAPTASAKNAVRVRPCYGPLREVEALRDWLLDLLATEPDAHGVSDLRPRDVWIFTPKPEIYGPLVASVFSRTGSAAAVTADEQTTSAEVAADPAQAESEELAPTGGLDEPAETEDDPTPVAPSPDADPSDPDDAPGRAAVAVPAIPVRIVESGLSRRNPLAATLMAIFELAADRVELPALFGLLSLRPLQQKFDYTAEELPAILALLLESGARWAFDADDRHKAGQPATLQNTLRFGLERMVLGRLLPADTLDEGDPREPRVAMDIATRDQLSLVLRLDWLLRALLDAVQTLATWEDQGLEPIAWRNQIDSLLNAFTQTSAASMWQRQRLEETLDEFLPRDNTPGLLSARAVRRHLSEGFSLPQAGASPNTGAVTFAPLRPHGAYPARVVALLGMELGAFPRGAALPTWHPLSAPTEGERTQRQLDTSAFEAACRGATERLWVSWPAFEMQRGRPLPPCAVVSALIEDAGLRPALDAAMHRAPATGAVVLRDASVARVHRHPWDAAPHTIFDLDHATVHTSNQNASAQPNEDSPDPYSEPLPDPDCPTALTVSDLVRAILNPSEVFLRDRLGIFIPDDEEPPPAREPLEMDNLDRYSLRRRLLDEHRAGRGEGAGERALRRLRGEGKLPLAAGAEALVMAQDDLILDLWEAWSDPQYGGEPSDLSATVAGVTLSTHVDRARATDGAWEVERLDVRSLSGNRPRMEAWVTALLACLSQKGQPATAILWGIGSKGPNTVEKKCADPDLAREELTALIGVWRMARTTPLPLFDGTSAEIAAVTDPASDGDSATASALRAAAQQFHGEVGEHNRPDGQNSHVRILHPTFDAVAALQSADSDAVRLARTVWGSLVKQEAAKKDDKTSTKPAKAAATTGKSGKKGSNTGSAK